MAETKFDLIVMGGGPGGYNAAERAAHAGLKTLLFEKQAATAVCSNKFLPGAAFLGTANQKQEDLPC